MLWKRLSHNEGFTESLIEMVFLLCACLSVLTTLAIVGVLLLETTRFLTEVSFVRLLADTSWTPLFAIKEYGILPLLTGTVLISVIALSVALPTGLLIAVYLAEYMPRGLQRWADATLEILAGIPTVAFGFLALVYVTPVLQSVLPGLKSFNALSPGIVLAIMVLPLIISLSRDAMSAVPQTVREAALALGSSRFQMTFRVIIPAASGGILASFALAFSRAVGETMIVTLAAGQSPALSLDPLAPTQTLTAYIMQVGMGGIPPGSLEYRTIFVVGALLFLMTLLLNGLSYRLRSRFRETWH